MTLEALIFGGIGTLAECAEIDRKAWNSAFRAHGVPWDWSWDTYAALMRDGGDRQLAARHVVATGVACGVPSEVLDRTHQKIFASILAHDLPLRPGVARVLAWSMRAGLRLALVTRAGDGPVRALLRATARSRFGIGFDLAILRRDVTRMAPNPEAMDLALAHLGVGRGNAAVVADTPAMAQAAQQAGLPVLAFPGQMARTEPGDFGSLPGVGILTPEAVTGAWLGRLVSAAE